MLSDRLAALSEELRARERITTALGLDIERPIKSVADGYPEHTIALVGKATERILKEVWASRGVKGNTRGKSLGDLLVGVRDHIESTVVLDALSDIQHLRNRAAHDGHEVEEEDAYTALRRFVAVLTWMETAEGTAPSSGQLRIDAALAERIHFLAGLYATIGYRMASRFDLSPASAYLLLERNAGIRTDYVEILLGSNLHELRQVLDESGGELLKTAYPKVTRFVLLSDFPRDDDGEGLDGSTILAYQGFLDTIIDSQALAQRAASQAAALMAGTGARATIQGDILELDTLSLSYRMRHLGDIESVISDSAQRQGANLLIIGGPGSGKTMLLLSQAASATTDGRYRFYVDLGDRLDEEALDELVVRQVGPSFAVARSEVWPLFLYLIRSGRCVCLLDAIDEGVPGGSISEVIELFGEMSVLLSASSTTIMASRQSFLMDTPYVRQLLDQRALVSEKLATGLVAEGVDPLALPKFSVIRLGGLVDADGISPLQHTLNQGSATAAGSLIEGVANVIAAACEDAGIFLPDLVAALGEGALRGHRRLSVLELHATLGPAAFAGPGAMASGCRLLRLFEPDGEHFLRYRHQVIREALAAEWFVTERPADPSLDGLPITDQCREFITNAAARRALHHPAEGAAALAACVVGPPGETTLHLPTSAARLERDPVTVGQYLEFVEAVRAGPAEAARHPAQPANEALEPWYERLRNPGYYTDPAYRDHPATCVSWWAAWAYASWRGTRLPTSMEWELAARGWDGRLFPWGDEADLAAANCADHWAGRLLPTYAEWKLAHDRGELRSGYPTPPGQFARNVSPASCRDMAGNVWEWTATLLPSGTEAVIAGGSYDNPVKAVRCSSRGAYRLAGKSNVVGFRVIEVGT